MLAYQLILFYFIFFGFFFWPFPWRFDNRISAAYLLAALLGPVHNLARNHYHIRKLVLFSILLPFCHKTLSYRENAKQTQTNNIIIIIITIIERPTQIPYNIPPIPTIYIYIYCTYMVTIWPWCEFHTRTTHKTFVVPLPFLPSPLAKRLHLVDRQTFQYSNKSTCISHLGLTWLDCV